MFIHIKVNIKLCPENVTFPFAKHDVKCLFVSYPLMWISIHIMIESIEGKKNFTPLWMNEAPNGSDKEEIGQM